MSINKRLGLWALICFSVVLANFRLLKELWILAETYEYASMIPLMPFMSAALIFRKRSQITVDRNPSITAMGVFALGLLFALLGGEIALKTAGIVTAWIALFVFYFGMHSLQKLMFPVLCLYMMIPIPEWLVQGIVVALQKGSGEFVALFFKLTGTAFQRTDLTFELPRVVIEIAPQCSGIRSTLALFISCLLAGHLMLRTTSRKIILLLVTIPLAMVKNAIRITALTLLAIHVDMGYLAGDLHRRGGTVFFVIALMIMWPVIWGLRKSEKNATNYTNYTNL